MNYTKDEIREGMLLYAVTDQSWLKDGQTLLSVCEEVLNNGATFLRSGRRIWIKIPLKQKQQG